MTDTQTATTTWTIDASHSDVEFAVKHMVFATAKGRFSDITGTIDFNPASPANSAVDVTIQVASVDTRDKKRDEHLRSADFFDADSYPTITFTSTRVEPVGDDVKVTGDLQIRGVTREVVLDAAFNGSGKSPFGHQVAGFSGATTINRKDFDLGWNAALESGGVLVGEDVKIALEIEATQA